MTATKNFSGKVARVRALFTTIVFGLALVACNGHKASTGADTTAVAVSGSGVTVDVVATSSWTGGFNGAVRITNTAFSSSITSFEVVFNIGSASVAGSAWNGTITGPDSSGNYTATHPSWLPNQPITTGKTWEVGFPGSGTFSSSTIVSVKVNGLTIPLTNDTNPPTVSLTSSATSVTTAGSITLTATASDAEGSISKVEFYDGSTLLGTITSSPYTKSVSLTSASNGTHSYTAKAYDVSGNSATSSAVVVTVNIEGGGTVSYELDPPDPCYNQYWVAGCESGTCGGRCQVANACSPPEDSAKASLPMTFACPRFMLYSDEMAQAAKDDWGDSSPFVYGVVGHDADTGGLDVGSSSCCQCYQLIFETPEQGAPNMLIPKPMIVQSFNTAAGGGKNFDIFIGAGGFGAFNACVPGTYSGTATTTFGHFMYTAFPTEYPTTGGIKAINISECKVNGAVTQESLQSTTCQEKITQLCSNTAASSSLVATETKNSCIQSNAVDAFYHQNWQVRAKRIECPLALTKVTGCRLASQGLPSANPSAKTAATADSSFLTGYTTTTMQDCCKPSCAWQDQVVGAGLKVVDKWTSFYSCDQNGVPITAP